MYKGRWRNAILFPGRSSIRFLCRHRLGRPALVDVARDFGRFGDVEVFQLLDFEARFLDQIRYMAIQVAATGQYAPAGCDAVLPFAGGIVGGFAVLQEQQVTARPEYPFHLLQRGVPVRDGA